MRYRVLADGIMLLHFAYIVFVIGGALLVLQRRWWMWLHLPAVAWGVWGGVFARLWARAPLRHPSVAWGGWVEFFARMCPLTPLENALRARAGQAGYAGGFIDHYITRLVYPEGLTARGQVVLGALVLIANVLLYWWVFRRARGPA